jgi:DNA ligase-1
MLLATVVETSARIAETSKRLQKIDLLANLLKRLEPREIEIVVPFLSGRTRQGRIGLGYATLRNAAGSPAASPSLTVFDIDAALDAITQVKGSGSQARRLEVLSGIFARATEPEQRFLFGLIMGELRQGALEGILIEGIARAAGVPADRIRRAVMMAGDATPVASTVLTEGEGGLTQYDLQLFRPVQPMLAGSAEDVTGALEELGEASLEWKLDGARIQVHKSGDIVEVYSRQLNKVTSAVPEVVESVRALPARDLILDGEVISLMPDGRPQPFQITMRRFGRRLNVDEMRRELPLQPFWFDVLYLDGGAVIDVPQQKRFGELVRLAPVDTVIPHLVTADAERAAGFMEDAIARGHEGVMAKALDAPYAAGARGQSWLKVKRARTLDLVVLAAEWGNGRRQGWLSNLHLGARDTEKGGFAMLGKTFKGLTDEMLEWQTKEFLKIEIGRDRQTVYVEPRMVVEIAFNEIQVSPHYESGLALRFARVKRYRLDKPVTEADTFKTVQMLAGVIVC